MMEEKVQTVLKVSPDLKERFKAMSLGDGRTMAGQFVWLVLREEQRRRRAGKTEHK